MLWYRASVSCYHAAKGYIPRHGLQWNILFPPCEAGENSNKVSAGCWDILGLSWPSWKFWSHWALMKYSGGNSGKRVPCSKTSSTLTSSLEVSIPSMTKLSLIQEFNPRTLWHALLLVGWNQVMKSEYKVIYKTLLQECLISAAASKLLFCVLVWNSKTQDVFVCLFFNSLFFVLFERTMFFYKITYICVMASKTALHDRKVM